MSRAWQCLVLLFTLTGPAAFAQLSGDPASIPRPVYPYQDPQRAVVIRLDFNSPTAVESTGVLVANTRARTAIGAPPQIVLELLDDQDRVIATRNEWHPLWERQWDETGETEHAIAMDSGPATFYVPLSSALRKVRITDTDLAHELITVDVSQAVIDYCNANPGTVICVLFRDGFE